MTEKEFAARLTVIERAIVDLAALVAELRLDAIDSAGSDMVGSSHELTSMD